MTNKNPTQPEPDPSTTQRVPDIQKVVDSYMSGWPTADPDRATTKPPKPRLWRRLVLLPAALILVVLTTAASCNTGARFRDHSDPRYAPVTPLHDAGVAPTHDPGTRGARPAQTRRAPIP